MEVQERTLHKQFTYLKVLLLVSNDAGENALITAFSRDMRYRIFVASNAFAAIKFLEHITPHLVIVDDSLPDMTGIQFCDYLRANHGLAVLPVIMCSASLEDVKDELTERHIRGFSKLSQQHELIKAITVFFASS